MFRSHPRRVELLEGLLGANLIGFHTFGYLRHFRSTVLRVLGVESEVAGVMEPNHKTALGVYPIGINAQKFQEELTGQGFRDKLAKYRENWRGKRIVLSVERLDYTKGILHRLEAIEWFLREHDDADRIVFIFISVPSREDVPEYQDLREEIEYRVGKINGDFATIENSPIHFIHQSVPFTELCALYSLADIALITPLIDGMNLVAKEYVACQEDDPGVLVLSEFAGAAQELVYSMIVNPYDARRTAQALMNALDMPLSDRQERMRYMKDRVLKYDSNYWARSFIVELTQAEPQAPVAVAGEEAVTAIVSRCQAAKRLALFLDYDGTLREFVTEPTKAKPTPDIEKVLKRLKELPNVDTFIISGRKRGDLDLWLGTYGFGLVSEHGAYYRRAGAEEWHELSPNADLSWKNKVIGVFQHYEGSTPGSQIEEKASALVWHYRQADPEFGQWKARQLLSDLRDMLANLPVEIHHGKKIVEVSSMHVNKGAALERIMREEGYDLALCAGDDQTDEMMFRVDAENVVKAKVGSGETHAQYRVETPAAFRDLLHRLSDALTGAPTGAA